MLMKNTHFHVISTEASFQKFWDAISRVPHLCKKLCSPGVNFQTEEVQVAFEFCQASSKS